MKQAQSMRGFRGSTDVEQPYTMIFAREGSGGEIR
jgi:hypothetical protein